LQGEKADTNLVREDCLAALVVEALRCSLALHLIVFLSFGLRSESANSNPNTPIQLSVFIMAEEPTPSKPRKGEPVSSDVF
jgi:hypothetical protein